VKKALDVPVGPDDSTAIHALQRVLTSYLSINVAKFAGRRREFRAIN